MSKRRQQGDRQIAVKFKANRVGRKRNLLESSPNKNQMVKVQRQPVHGVLAAPPFVLRRKWNVSFCTRTRLHSPWIYRLPLIIRQRFLKGPVPVWILLSRWHFAYPPASRNVFRRRLWWIDRRFELGRRLRP